MEKSAIISFRAIGTQEGSLLYQSSLSGRLVHRKWLSCTILERAASSSGDFTKKGHPDSGWPLERKTRLELATPTLARSCSTN